MLLILLCFERTTYGQEQNAAGAASESAGPEKVALHPFKGSPDDIASQFFQIEQQALPGVGNYTPFLIDMNNLPDDVPPGGFPAYVCPSPSITGDSTYAVTGEVTPDTDDSSSYHLRLYLWEMSETRLIYSDELSARDQSECETNLPPLLTWLFSWIKKNDGSAAQAAQSPASEPEKWLYLGLRAGSSLRFFAREDASPFLEDQRMHFFNFNAALQASVHLLSFLDVQTEIILTNEYAPFTYKDKNSAVDTTPFTALSMMIPVLARFNMRKGPLVAGVVGGLYFALPLGQMNNDAPDPDYGGSYDFKLDLPVGYMAGVNVGMKLGPGWLFLDVRWAADLGETQSDGGAPLYRRSMVMINIGYEMGFFTKKNKTDKPVTPPASGAQSAPAGAPPSPAN
jgi:hypothetical protein